jgi:hypothetical protein
VITALEGIRDAGLWAGLTAIEMVNSQRAINGAAQRRIRECETTATGQVDAVSVSS